MLDAMTKRIAPYFANTSDNTHCYQASMRMVLKYFLPKKNFSWKKLEELSAKKEGKWTWPTQMQINLQKMGLELIVIDKFDIDSFIAKGGSYLVKIWGKEMGEAQIRHSDIEQERRLFKTYKKLIKSERRAPTLRDLKRLIRNGYLIECNVNSAALNKRKGYAGHSVLVFDYNKSHIILHDPGLPAHPHRKVTNALFKKAWMYPSDGHQSLTAIRLLAKSGKVI